MGSEGSRARAKAYVAEARATTTCERCGAQPVEYHHVDHERHGNQRVARLAARGVSVERIRREIDRCEALCRRCHMTVDGRLEALAEVVRSRPVQDPQPCEACGVKAKPRRRGMCRRCYDQERRR